ncbi:hypothetical protein D9757_006078 [Collybiopsis confluens]|uniref:Uncharacterized protein n=1 Tax=Collybiopsis confluens TaxID=2823264 RepID=A0A8H5HHE4_9AGAR|nr:hypothetical protein D9757_006078 [Collybiopsis confluens]
MATPADASNHSGSAHSPDIEKGSFHHIRATRHHVRLEGARHPRAIRKAFPPASMEARLSLNVSRGLGQIIVGVMEWISRNTFPSVVFTSFGGFFLGLLNDPEHNIAGALGGGTSVALNDGLLFYSATWGTLCLVYLIAALRTSLVFVVSLVMSYQLLSFTGVCRELANGNASMAGSTLKAAGAFAFVTCVCGWYLLVAPSLCRRRSPTLPPCWRPIWVYEQASGGVR